MDQQHKEALLSAAVQASETAYAPYSKFRVGAALLGKNDVIYRGVNVENASYGLTICASPGGVAPCGACRQVLHEFAPDIKIFLVDTSGEKPVTELSLNVLLPHAFFGLDES